MIEKTKKIYNILKEGKFINNNSFDKSEQKLFNFIQENYDYLDNVFKHIGLNLILNKNYAYFATEDEDTIGKLKNIIKLIKYIDFFKFVDFEVGYKFNISTIENKIVDDAILKEELNLLIKKEDRSIREQLEKILKEFSKKNYIVLLDKENGEYVINSSYDYLLDFISKIEIKKEEK